MSLLAVEPEIRRLPPIVDPVQVPHRRRHGSWAWQTLAPERLFHPTNGLLVQAGVAVAEADGPLSVEGTDLLIYRYEIPGDARQLDFRAQLAGDYSVDVAATYGWSGVASRFWSDWHNVRRAPGNVRDGSNLGWVNFSYGFPTGLVNYGGNFRFRWGQTAIEGEYVDNGSQVQFPGAGKRQRRHRRAYFLKGFPGFGKRPWSA